MRAIKGYVPKIVSGIIISYFNTFQFYYLAVGLLPPCNALQQVAKIKRSTELRSTSGIKDTELCIEAGIPPIPPRLVTRIQSREFIDMADSLPDQPATTSTDRTSKHDGSTSPYEKKLLREKRAGGQMDGKEESHQT